MLTLSATQYDFICLSMIKDFLNDYEEMDIISDPVWPTTTGEYVNVFMDYSFFVNQCDLYVSFVYL